jgi:hypothetical protein
MMQMAVAVISIRLRKHVFLISFLLLHFSVVRVCIAQNVEASRSK